MTSAGETGWIPRRRENYVARNSGALVERGSRLRMGGLLRQPCWRPPYGSTVCCAVDRLNRALVRAQEYVLRINRSRASV